MKHFIPFFIFLLPFCLYGQIKETFDGPELTSAYDWIQDSDEFYLYNGQLTFDISGRSKGKSYIRLKTDYSENMEWQCDVSFTFNPTNSNHARIYVYATAQPSNLAFYIKIGGAQDNVCLYTQEGTHTPILQIEGREGLLDQDFPSVRVRLTMEKERKWTLYTSTDQGENYFKEGEYTCELKDIRPAGFLNLACCYAATSYKNAFIDFDNLIVSPEILNINQNPIDSTKEKDLPELEYIQPLSTNCIQVGFDKPVLIENAIFSLSTIGDASVIKYVDTEKKTEIKMMFEKEMELYHEYKLSIDGLKTISGIQIPLEEFIFSLTPEEETIENIPKGAVQFNEIMANPKGLKELPETEYIELYNTTDTTYSLENWKFMYGTTKIILPDYQLNGKSYVILYREGREINTEEGIGLEHFPYALANNGKELRLYDPTDQLIDQYTYPAAKPAQSWEKVNGEWQLSTDPRGGTPGMPNCINDPATPDQPDNPLKYESGDVLINEIMADPNGLIDLPETEYIEILNVSQQPVNLKNWIFQYGEDQITLPEHLLPIKGYAVLYRQGKELFCDKNALALGLEHFPSSLNNNGKQLQLYDASGTLIDQYSYKKATAGLSWERSSTDWYLCTDSKGGTPGAANSDPNGEPDDSEGSEEPVQPIEENVAPLDIIFNELLPDPFLGGSEYIELYNRSTRALQLKGLAISTRKSNGILSTCYPLPEKIIEPGQYLALSKNKEGVTSFYLTCEESNIIEIAKLPILANTTADLVLYKIKDSEIIDEIKYTDDWHSTSIKNKKGVALERISPDRPTQSADNWTSGSSLAGYGTPGCQNSQYNKEQEDKITGITSPTWLGENQYSIRYLLDKSGYNCRIFIYNTIGQCVTKITRNELIGIEGEITWDGNSSQGERLTPGVYIFYAELYHTGNGSTKRYKKAFLVH